MTGVIQLSFKAPKSEELPHLPFNEEIELTLNGWTIKARVTKATIRDGNVSKMFDANNPHEVTYTLDVGKGE